MPSVEEEEQQQPLPAMADYACYIKMLPKIPQVHESQVIKWLSNYKSVINSTRNEGFLSTPVTRSFHCLVN